MIDDDAEEKMRRFVEALVDGATLMLHPDTWTDFRANLTKLPGELALAVMLKKIPVIPSEFIEPGQMIAFKSKRFEFGPTFKFAEPSPLDDQLGEQIADYQQITARFRESARWTEETLRQNWLTMWPTMKDEE